MICVYCLFFIMLSALGDKLDNAFVMNCPDCEVFPSNNSNNSAGGFVTIDKMKNEPVITVGGREVLLTMTMDGKLLHQLPIPGIKEDYETCMQYEVDKTFCANTIDTIIPILNTDTMFACGTNSRGTQLCWKTNETHIIGKPQNYFFFNSEQHRKSLVLGSQIIQGYSDLYSIKVVRSNIITGLKELELTQGKGTFISFHEFGDFIYLFFTGTSEEILDKDSQITYSFVGRICKYDKGGDLYSPVQLFMTFSKARLLCTSTTDSETFQYNNLEKTTFSIGDDGEGYIYGLFRASKPVDAVFAVCRYKLSDIDKVFESRMYYDIRSDKVERIKAGDADSRHFTCNVSINTQVLSYEDYKTMLKTRMLHVDTVTPDTNKPMIIRDDPTIKHILADSATIANKKYDIIRLFDSYSMREIFFPDNSGEEKYISLRKISDQPLNINKVIKMKFTRAIITTTPSSKIVSSSVLAKSSTHIPSTPSVDTSSSLNNSSKLGNTSSPSFNQAMTAVPTKTLSVLVPSSQATLGPRTPRMTSNSWAEYTDQENMIIASDEKMVFAPVASCSGLTSCRDCVSAKNPYCAWYQGSCIQLNSTENRSYIQDLKNGNYSKVCPQVGVSCKLMRINELVPDMEFSLQCLPGGIPTPRVTKWSLPSKREDSNDNPELKIPHYTVEAAGKYACHVSNGVTTNSCSIEIPGAAPEIDCQVTKSANEFFLTCSASGHPQPQIMLGNNTQRGRIKVKVESGVSYQPFAYNSFDATDGGVYRIVSMSLDFEIKGRTWDDELLDKNSPKYKELQNKIKIEVEKLYKNSSLFQKIASIVFREGSVIASVELSGLQTPSSDEDDLLGPLQRAIQDGNLGDLDISEPDDTPTPGSDQPSTSPTLTSPSTPEITSRDTSAVGQSSSSPGVPVWLLFLLLIIIGILVFLVGYCCGLRGILARFFKERKRSTSCSEEDGEELKGMSRSEKSRESERMLLKKHQGKKQKSPVKKNNHEHNNVSKHASDCSVEIKQFDNEDGKNTNDNST